MSKQKFKVGDRVMVTRDVLGIRCAGKIGTIIPDFPSTVGREDGRYVRFDNPVESPEGQRDYVWTVNREIKLIHEKKKYPVVVITSDGKTTTATMREGKNVLKTATATCSEKDTFSFDEGARIAFERLQGREPFPVKDAKSPFPKKVVCVSCDSKGRMFTPGKVYTITHDRSWYTDTIYCVSTNYTDITCGIVESKIVGHYETNTFPWLAKFIPLVED